MTTVTDEQLKVIYNEVDPDQTLDPSEWENLYSVMRLVIDADSIDGASEILQRHHWGCPVQCAIDIRDAAERLSVRR